MLPQFGIPTLDELIEPPFSKASKHAVLAGNGEVQAESIAILGPDGTGKSVLALHLASRYAADCARASAHQARIFYVSSDLKHASAKKIWEAFGLDQPNHRDIPFEPTLQAIRRRSPSYSKPTLKVELAPFSPEKSDDLVEYLIPTKTPALSQVAFIDLASHTAGDDWKFVNTLLVQLQSIGQDPGHPHPHLVIIDSVEGFETFVGRLDSYGNEQSRRARVAQCMRNAGKNVQLVFVVEEPNSSEHLAEEYVTDVVLRLRNRTASGPTVHTVQVQKARSREHAKGEHPYEIRSKDGTSTGSWVNADTPRIGNSYLHVFKSISHRSRKMSAQRGKGEMEVPEHNAEFGLKYLDELLTYTDSKGKKSKGLQAGTVTALIGDSSIDKSVLGERFIAEGFKKLVGDYIVIYACTKQGITDSIKDRYDCIRKKLCAGIFGIRTNARCAQYQSSATTPEQGLRDAARSGLAYSQLELDQVVDEDHTVDKRRLRPAHVLRTINKNKLDEDELDHRLLAEWKERTDALKQGSNPGVTPKSRPWPDLKWIEETTTLNLTKLFLHPNLTSPAVLFTTTDRRGTDVAKRCVKLLHAEIAENLELTGLDPSQHQTKIEKSLAKLIDQQLIVRRFDMQPLPEAAIFDMIHRNVFQAIRLIFGIALPVLSERRYKKDGRIRVVIDDLSVLAKINPAIVQDEAFLPFLAFHLRREGVVSLFIHTDSIRPDVIPANEVTKELLSIVERSILTWNAPFEGRSRTAITVVPQHDSDLNGLVRELTLSDKRPDVTRQFELYSGIEEGKPLPVPLAIYLFDETPQFNKYIENENLLFREVFTGVKSESAVEPGRVIFPIDAKRYQALRDFTNLTLDALDSHTLVFQVDEHWAAQGKEHMLRDLREYLTEPLPQTQLRNQDESDRRHADRTEDPFDLFTGKPGSAGPQQGSEPNGKPQPGSSDTTEKIFARKNFFGNKHYSIPEPPTPPSDNDPIFKVPFMWDFGFVLARSAPYEMAKGEDVQGLQPTVEDVFKQMRGSTPPSWREFFGACKEIAEIHHRQVGTELVPFDIACTSADTLSAFLLEVWLSEIRLQNDLSNYKTSGLLNLSKLLALPDDPSLQSDDEDSIKRRFKNFRKACKDQISAQKQGEPNNELASLKEKCDNLFKTLPLGALCLYKTWLLLIEVLDIDQFLDPEDPFALRFPPRHNPNVVASRHWYKTACAYSQHLYHSEGIHDSVMAMRLPGHYSTRGDWYLGTPKSSRSHLLAQHAIDLLSSRRANNIRMQQGLGLPVRDVAGDDVFSKFSTALRCLPCPQAASIGKDKSSRELIYKEVAQLGVEGSEQFEWLFRSQIKDYNRLSRPLQRWLVRMLRWTVDYRNRHARNWEGGFRAYDELTNNTFDKVANYDSFDEFAELCDLLLGAIQAASREASK